MGNTDSGDVGSNLLDNDDSNWFQTDMDSSFTFSNKDTELNRNLEKSSKPAANFRSFSVDRAMTPVSMVSPIMKNSNPHQRSYSVGKTLTPTTPVSMVSPIMKSNTSKQQRHYDPTPVSMVSPIMRTHQLTYQNPNTDKRYLHNIVVKKNHTTNQTTKRASSISKTQPVSYDNQGANAIQQAKRSYSTPRHVLKNQSQIFYTNYQHNIDPNQQLIYTKPNQNIGYAYLKPITPTQHQTNPIMFKHEPDFLVRPVYLRQNPSKSVKQSTKDMHDRNNNQTIPVIAQIYSVPIKGLPPTRKVNIEKLSKLPAPSNNLVSEKFERSRKYTQNQPIKTITTHRSKSKSTQRPSEDMKQHREFKYSGIVSTANPSYYNQQYGSLLPEQSKVASIPLNSIFKTTQQFAENQRSDLPKLIGDIEALKLIDLDAAGLGEYKNFVSNILPKYASNIQPIKTFKRSIPKIAYTQPQLNKKIAKPSKQITNTQNLLNYYQNPQFLTSAASLAQSKINYISGYENIHHNNQFNSVYLSGY